MLLGLIAGHAQDESDDIQYAEHSGNGAPAQLRRSDHYPRWAVDGRLLLEWTAGCQMRLLAQGRGSQPSPADDLPLKRISTWHDCRHRLAL